MSAVQSGDAVEVHYTGRFEDGDVFDSSVGGEPMAFVAGSTELIPGVSNAVIGMKVGDKKTVEVEPEQGYGERNPELAQRVPREQLPPEIKVGDQLAASQGDKQFAVWVLEVGETDAVIDANHPLAGRKLVFDLELVSIGES